MKTAKGLREGFTTGSAATGAALAALHLLRHGHAPATVRVPLPPFAGGVPRGHCELTVDTCSPGPAPELPILPEQNVLLRAAHARIIKDGGDDPDVTTGAHITATVLALPEDTPEQDTIRIEGGPGVGRVTLPGLPVPPGQAAINPVPREQMLFALRHALTHPPDPALRGSLTVIVSVPEGERLAKKTFNPRLGILGGISILGTHGTVRPYSHAAWKATIQQGLAVAAATGCPLLCLTTGRRSERLLMQRYPHLPASCFLQVADFAGFSLKKAGALPHKDIVWGCFFGKLLKLAQGHACTHAHTALLDMAALAHICRDEGAACAKTVADCATAAHALELLLPDPRGQKILLRVAEQAASHAARLAGRPVRLHLFHTDGRELLTLCSPQTDAASTTVMPVPCRNPHNPQRKSR